MKPASGFLGKLQALLSRTGPYKVNLGCGRCFHPEWVNFDFTSSPPDVIAHDLRDPLPLGNSSCAVVYSSHVLEHFPRAFAPVFLRECARLLQPGGTLRIVVPDLETIARLYLRNLEGAESGDAQAASRHEWMTIELVDQLVRERSGGEMLNYWKQNPMPEEEFVVQRVGREVLQFIEAFRKQPPQPAPTGYSRPTPDETAAFRQSGELHQWMYDRRSLRALIEAAGFTNVQVCAAGQSRIPYFNRYQLDINPDGSARKPDSLFMEAEKQSNSPS